MKKILNILLILGLLALPGNAGETNVKIFNIPELQHQFIVEQIGGKGEILSKEDVTRAIKLAYEITNIAPQYTTKFTRIVIHVDAEDDPILFFSELYQFIAYYCREKLEGQDSLLCPSGRTVHIVHFQVKGLAAYLKGPERETYIGVLAHELMHHLLFDIGLKDPTAQHCLLYSGLEQESLRHLGIDPSPMNEFYSQATAQCLQQKAK